MYTRNRKLIFYLFYEKQAVQAFLGPAFIGKSEEFIKLPPVTVNYNEPFQKWLLLSETDYEL